MSYGKILEGPISTFWALWNVNFSFRDLWNHIHLNNPLICVPESHISPESFSLKIFLERIGPPRSRDRQQSIPDPSLLVLRSQGLKIHGSPH